MISALSGIAIRRKISEMIILGFAAAGLAYLFGKIVQSTFGIEVSKVPRPGIFAAPCYFYLRWKSLKGCHGSKAKGASKR